MIELHNVQRKFNPTAIKVTKEKMAEIARFVEYFYAAYRSPADIHARVEDDRIIVWDDTAESDPEFADDGDWIVMNHQAGTYSVLDEAMFRKHYDVTSTGSACNLRGE